MARRKPRGPGRPLLLTPETQGKLIEATRIGSPMQIAATYAGISVRTFELWMARGHAEDQARADGADPVEAEQPYLDLFEKVMEARAQAAVKAVVNINRVATGGIITEEVTKKYRDPVDGKIIEETTVKRTAPDWRASAWYLERQHRSHYGKDATQVEVTGAGGGPIQIAVDAESLAERVQRNIAELAAASVPALSAGPADIVDAEMVGAPDGE